MNKTTNTPKQKITELSIKEASIALGKTERTVWRLIKQGELKTKKRGNKLYISSEAIKKLGGSIENAKQNTMPQKYNHSSIISEAVRTLEPKIEELFSNTIKELQQNGVINEQLDRLSVYQYSYYLTLAKYLMQQAEKDDFESYAANGTKTIHPKASLATQCEKIAMSYSNMLGLNPRARSRLKLESKIIDDSGIGQFIN
jgi:phage terminase small subunit